MRETIGFQFGNEDFFVLARKSRDCAEAYRSTPHKRSSAFDTARAKKDRFRMETIKRHLWGLYVNPLFLS